jgi:DNA-binding NarL/FixJ family response regulator
MRKLGVGFNRNGEGMKELTPREKEVLEYICKGYTNTEIAQKLIVSTHTAKAHVKHILEKFNAQNRVQVAYKNGLIQSDEPKLNE